MIYLVIFNTGRKIGQERIKADTWLKFIENLNRLIELQYQQLPDLIYLETPK